MLCWLEWWICCQIFRRTGTEGNIWWRCPANQIASDAQIIIYDQTVFSSADIRRFANSSDPNLTFFREILGYSEDEIQQDVQNAFQFFSERFGLEFSLAQPNELGLHFFQNARTQAFSPQRLSLAVLTRGKAW